MFSHLKRIRHSNQKHSKNEENQGEKDLPVRSGYLEDVLVDPIESNMTPQM